jgi:hypothetical protein
VTLEPVTFVDSYSITLLANTRPQADQACYKAAANRIANSASLLLRIVTSSHRYFFLDRNSSSNLVLTAGSSTVGVCPAYCITANSDLAIRS